MMATCERMFAQMPEDFPPKRMMRSIDEIRANSERILELLSGREQVGEPELVPGEVETTEGENAMVPA